MKEDYDAKVWIEFDPPMIFRKPHPTWPDQYVLEMSVVGIKEKNGPWYLTEHSVIRTDRVERIGRSDWADWSQSGDLLFAKDGRLFRLRTDDGVLTPMPSRVEIANFCNLAFEERVSPSEARLWPGPPASRLIGDR